jgi:putative peptidoglycan lipid II flippase
LSAASTSTTADPANWGGRDLASRRMDRRILRAAAAVTIAGILVKVAATLKEVVVAGLYGRSDAMDAFLAAFLIPNLLVNVIAETMNQALIPTLIRVRLKEGHRKARELLSNSMLWMCILLSAACAVMAVAARSFFPLLAWNFPPAKLELCLQMFWGLLPMVVLTGIATNCTAVLNSLGRFALPALAPALIPISVMAGALLWHLQLGIWALMVFTTVGAAAQVCVIAWSMASRGYPMSLRWYGWNDATWEVARQYGPVLLSAVVASGGLLVDQALAASLPAGSISALVFAGRFVGVVLTLLAGAVSSVTAPHFSTLAARRDWQGCRTTIRQWTRFTAAIAIPAAAVLIIGAHLLVRVTLQHGVFTPRDTSAVAPVLALYAIQIPFFAVSRVYYRFVLAMRRTDMVLYCGVLNLILDVVLDLVLMRYMGVAGLALATSLWTVSTCGFFRICARRLLARAEAS